MEIRVPQIEPDVPGPDGRSGFLLRVPRSEALEWDIRNEIGSTSRYWIPERQAWWIASPYRHSAEEIVRRAAPLPAARRGEARPAGVASRLLAAARREWAALGALLSRRPR